jgi:hypothetical protein
MDIAEDMHAYYASEKEIAATFVSIGMASTVAGGAMFASESEFARGLGGSFLVLGALQTIGAGFYGFQVDAQLAYFSSVLARSEWRFKEEESAHIHGTTSRFTLYRLSELGLAIAGAGVAAYGFAADRDVWKGIGVGVASQATLFLVIDSFGAARAHAYEERVRTFSPSLVVCPYGASAGFSARF